MIHLVTALPCEAKPLIRRYRLHGRQRENGFRIYENEQLRLIISGIGSCAAAAACAYLQGADPRARHVWINLGVAGHPHLDVGEAVLAHKLSDAASGNTWYPPLPFQPPCATVDLVSVAHAEHAYPDDSAYDMEAAGFYAAASRFNSHELVHVFKVISDNAAHPADQVTAVQVEALIDARLDCLDALLQTLTQLDRQLAEQQATAAIMDTFLQRWHFSVAQQHQLQRLLQRCQALGETRPDVADFAGARNSRQVITALRQRIDAMPLSFAPA